MMFEEEDRRPAANSSIPRRLDSMSIEALHDYVGELETEIERVKNEIIKKERIRDQASSVFRGS